MSYQVTYAIGDVHGEAARLIQLHQSIFQWHKKSYPDAKLRLVHLGDYVDRGPDSAGVIECLLQKSQDEQIDTVMLAGNHEVMMLNAMQDKCASDYQFWLRNGGEETLQSYKAKGYTGVPEGHLAWLRDLPTIHFDEHERRIFVHAGLRPRLFPNEAPDVHLWTRAADFFDTAEWRGTELEGWTVIHGHTPTKSGWPDDIGKSSRRINLDTGAVFGGRLTCAVLAPGEDVRYLYA